MRGERSRRLVEVGVGEIGGMQVHEDPPRGTAAREIVGYEVARPPTDDVQVDDAVHLDAAVRLKDSSTPERELMRQEIERTVFETVEALPEELRQAITLREVDGLSYEEIAESMNCPIGTVRSRIFRAREAIDEKLRPLLSDVGGHEPE